MDTIQIICRKLIDHYGTVTEAAERAGIERTMFNRIAVGSRSCACSPRTATRIRDALEEATGEHYTLDEIYGGLR